MLFPDWLLEQRKRAVAGDVTCYRLGVSNRRMAKPIEQVSIPGSAIPRSARAAAPTSLGSRDGPPARRAVEALREFTLP
jgi:hypothetical protein